MITSKVLIPIIEVVYSSGPKRVSVVCDDLEEVRAMVEKFLHASAPGNSDHEPSLRITRKVMGREEFEALEDWDGGGSDKAGKGEKKS